MFSGRTSTKSVVLTRISTHKGTLLVRLKLLVSRILVSFSIADMLTVV